MATTKTPAKPKAAAKKAAAPKTPKAAVPCKCNTLQVGGTDESPEFGPCGAETRRDFAPGHDARLKGLLIKLHVEGKQFKVKGQAPRQPLAVAQERQWGGYLTAAKERSERRVVAKAKRDEAAAQRKAEATSAREAKQAEKAAAKAAKQAEANANKPAKAAAIKTNVGDKVGVRIGRQVYAATVTASGPNEITVDYNDSKGNAKTGVSVKRTNVVAAPAA